MVPSASTTATIIAAALLVAIPAHAGPVASVADFLTTIGGDTDMKTIGSNLSDPTAEIYPLTRDGSEVIGYRFFSEKLTANGSATAERTRAAFVQECVAKGGRIEPEDSNVDRGFKDRVLGRRIPRRGDYKHFWSELSAVCSRSPSEVMGGFVAITYDTTEVATKGDMGSRLLSKIWLQPTQTAVYAYRPERIRTAASFEARDAAILANYAEQRANEAFQKDIVVGTETNCGTVIQVRGPMVEIAVSPVRPAPNGQSTFWSKRTVLTRPGPPSAPTVSDLSVQIFCCFTTSKGEAF